MTDDIALWWGVKASLVDYVLTMGEGRIVADHESVAPDGSRVFGFAAEPAEPLRFRGDLRFVAHGGMLDVRLRDPRAELGDSPALTADRVSHLEQASRLRIADLVRSADDSSWPGFVRFGATLTAEATALFDGMYPRGSELAPVWIASSAAG